MIWVSDPIPPTPPPASFPGSPATAALTVPSAHPAACSPPDAPQSVS